MTLASDRPPCPCPEGSDVVTQYCTLDTNDSIMIYSRQRPSGPDLRRLDHKYNYLGVVLWGAATRPSPHGRNPRRHTREWNLLSASPLRGRERAPNTSSPIGESRARNKRESPCTSSKAWATVWAPLSLGRITRSSELDSLIRLEPLGSHSSPHRGTRIAQLCPLRLRGGACPVGQALVGPTLGCVRPKLKGCPEHPSIASAGPAFRA